MPQNVRRERRNAPGRIVLPVAIVLALLLAACNPCRKASGLVAKAVRKCPEMAQLRTDTIHLQLPADSTKGSAPFTAVDIDSVYAACEQIREALDAERALANITNDIVAGVVNNQFRTIDSLRSVLRKGSPSVQRLRESLCRWPDILDSNERHILRIRYSPSGPLYTIIDRAVKQQAVTVHQEINGGAPKTACDMNRLLLALCIVLAIAAFLAIMHARSERNLRRAAIPPK